MALPQYKLNESKTVHYPEAAVCLKSGGSGFMAQLWTFLVSKIGHRSSQDERGLIGSLIVGITLAATEKLPPEPWGLHWPYFALPVLRF